MADEKLPPHPGRKTAENRLSSERKDAETRFLRQFPLWVSIRMEASAPRPVRPQQNSHETRIS
ncbi:hypothetical protein DLM_0849 [Aquitalea magnusonii]|uniref:Uncharacterized protein n=1 Tax=Aquitalea magnusonii TaxID=332411 RepID=A0A3G9GAH4_9NEIS|nr:hypothetical protein DLM_0849 [Aquitalea magnusonii]